MNCGQGRVETSFDISNELLLLNKWGIVSNGATIGLATGVLLCGV